MTLVLIRVLQEIVELRARGWVSRGEKAILSRGGAFSRSPRTVYMKSYNYFVSCLSAI